MNFSSDFNQILNQGTVKIPFKIKLKKLQIGIEQQKDTDKVERAFHVTCLLLTLLFFLSILQSHAPFKALTSSDATAINDILLRTLQKTFTSKTSSYYTVEGSLCKFLANFTYALSCVRVNTHSERKLNG